MKRSFLTLFLCVVTTGIGYAQFTKNTVLQPTSVTAKKYDAQGQIVNEIPSTFTYALDGKLIGYELPSHSLRTSYSYNDNLLMEEYTHHSGGHPTYDEIFVYTYENYQVKTKSHLWSQMNTDEFWVYEYNSEGLLVKMDYKDETHDDYHMHWLYEYEDEGKTKIENYWTSWVSQGMLLRKRTVSQYDNAGNMLTQHAESYNTAGEPTQTTLKTYSYTPNGMEESETTQTLHNEEWINTSIVKFVYDDNDRVTERQVGAWSDEISDWVITNKTTYEVDEEASTLTVSFFKKNGEEWVWDEYGAYYVQPIFYDSFLEAQERALEFYLYDGMSSTEHINQFEFTLAQTEVPTYEDVEDNKFEACHVHPNPTSGLVTITGKDLRQAEVLNTLGQRVATATGEGETLQVDIAKLPAGVYFVNVTDKDGRKCVRKVVKE